MTRVLVVFSSFFGANAELASLVEPILVSAGAEVCVRRAEQLTPDGHARVYAGIDLGDAHEQAAPPATGDDLVWADGIILSSPSHTGLLSSAMKDFIDTHHEAAVAAKFLNRTFTAMATSGFAHAGQERVVGDLNAVAAAWGCILVPPSTANADINTLDGNPFGLSFVLEHGKLTSVDNVQIALTAHLTRFVAVTAATEPLRERNEVAPTHKRSTIADAL